MFSSYFLIFTFIAKYTDKKNDLYPRWVRNGNSFGYLKSKFQKLSKAKIKERIFIGAQIRELMQDLEFDECSRNEERKDWLSVKNVIRNFLGNHKSKDYKRYVNKMLTQFQGLNVNMSLKIHFLVYIDHKVDGL